MPRKAPPQQSPVARRSFLWLGWKLVIALSVTLCLLTLLSLHHHYSLGVTAPSVLLAAARSRISAVEYSGDRPKVSFLFLARRDLPLDFLWDSFFKGADQGNFSIYIHSMPGFVFYEDTTTSQFFYNRQLQNSINVVWGESSMVAAERLLLAVSLEDPSNQRFVLLSDSCVPLYDFGYTYRYIMSSPKSYVDSFLNTKENRYSLKMSPDIPEEKWRKGSQWISLIRSHAEVIANDDIVFPVFEKFCKRSPPRYFRAKWLYKLQKRHNCIPDEHYVQTLLTMRGLESEIESRTLTYTVWNRTAARNDTKSWHPITFTSENTGPERIKEIKRINHVYYQSEYRTEWCRADTKLVPCFLFARKFTIGAAIRLLRDGSVGSSKETSL